MRSTAARVSAVGVNVNRLEVAGIGRAWRDSARGATGATPATPNGLLATLLATVASDLSGGVPVRPRGLRARGDAAPSRVELCSELATGRGFPWLLASSPDGRLTGVRRAGRWGGEGRGDFRPVFWTHSFGRTSTTRSASPSRSTSSRRCGPYWASMALWVRSKVVSSRGCRMTRGTSPRCSRAT